MRIRLVKIVLMVLAFIIAANTINLIAQQKAPDTYFYSNNKKVYLKNFEGKRIMFWMFSTWCPSCIAGFNALAEKQPELKKDSLTVIVLRNYKNGGDPGPTETE